MWDFESHGDSFRNPWNYHIKFFDSYELAGAHVLDWHSSFCWRNKDADYAADVDGIFLPGIAGNYSGGCNVTIQQVYPVHTDMAYSICSRCKGW